MSGVATRVHEADGVLAFERVQDVEPILDFTRAMRWAGDVGSSDMRHAASIPMVLVESYCNARGITFQRFMAEPEHIKNMCNDPALGAFRIWQGRL